MIVDVNCFTNVDDMMRQEWPERMYCPKIGDRVESKTGKFLFICAITHRQDDDGSPRLRVELMRWSSAWRP